MGYIKPVIRNSKRKRNGNLPIELRITIKRYAHFVSIGVDIDEKYWDNDKNRLKKSYPNSARTNNLISHYIAKAEDYLVEMQTKNVSPNIRELRTIVFNKNKTKYSFSECAKEYLNDLELGQKYSRSNRNRRFYCFNLFELLL
jgi:hypothetical protein